MQLFADFTKVLEAWRRGEVKTEAYEVPSMPLHEAVEHDKQVVSGFTQLIAETLPTSPPTLPPAPTAPSDIEIMQLMTAAQQRGVGIPRITELRGPVRVTQMTPEQRIEFVAKLAQEGK